MEIRGDLDAISAPAVLYGPNGWGHAGVSLRVAPILGFGPLPKSLFLGKKRFHGFAT
jgi:hypothetical protein